MEKLQKATLANGCFWCTEAVFQELKGVHEVTSGYTGGEVENPTYEQVSNGNTGHAEAIQITFDPNVISYKELLEVFWKTHDPTTLNRQGADVGTQYRSAIFYENAEQEAQARESLETMEKSGEFDDPIVTEITPLKKFYPAEEYHADFYNKNRGNNYCQLIIDPKIDKLRKDFSEKVKENKG